MLYLDVAQMIFKFHHLFSLFEAYLEMIGLGFDNFWLFLEIFCSYKCIIGLVKLVNAIGQVARCIRTNNVLF